MDRAGRGLVGELGDDRHDSAPGPEGLSTRCATSPRRAIEAIERARRLSPFDPYTFFTPVISLSLISLRDASNKRSTGPTAPCTTSRVSSQRCGSKSSPMPISAGSTRRAPNFVERLPSTPS